MKDKRDNIDELFHSKLHDFEVDTMPGDWEAIADRLSQRSARSLRRKLIYWAAAAVVALTIGIGTLHFYDTEVAGEQYAQEIEKETKQLEERIINDIATPTVAKAESAKAEQAAPQPVQAKARAMRVAAVAQPMTLHESEDDDTIQMIVDEKIDDEAILTKTDGDWEIEKKEVDADPQPFLLSTEKPLLADAEEVKVKDKGAKPARRWGFGMGGGNLSMAANNVVPQYVTNSTGLRAENLHYMNALSNDHRGLPKTNIKHKTPLSFAVGVSYRLNDRWALQSGLSYTYLSSKWETSGEYHGNTHQALHYLGIPLNVIYRFADWNKFSFYTTGGVMAEKNIAGQVKTKLYAGDEFISTINEDVDMKRLMWSLNARVGVDYPLLRFLSAYAEVGAGYYFDNGSDVETVRSEKPFNVGLQVGFRFGL